MITVRISQFQKITKILCVFNRDVPWCSRYHQNDRLMTNFAGSKKCGKRAFTWGRLIEWNFSENGRSSYEEMHFENCKKSSSAITQMSIFRPCSQVMASGVGMRTEADTAPVCSTLGSLIEWSFSKNGRSSYTQMHFQNSQKLTSLIMEISIIRPCSQVMASGIGKRTEADTLSVCSIVELCNWVEFLGKWPEHLSGDAFWKLQKIDVLPYATCILVIFAPPGEVHMTHAK